MGSKPTALPSELTRYICIVTALVTMSSKTLVGMTGIEPVTSCVTGKHSNQLNYIPTGTWCIELVSNQPLGIFSPSLIHLSYRRELVQRVGIEPTQP